MSAQTVFADFTISMSEFKTNPSRIVEEQNGQPIAVLNRNKAAFYVVPPDVYEAMMDELDEARLTPIIKERLLKNKRVRVDIASL